jgi:hypothetical protein
MKIEMGRIEPKIYPDFAPEMEKCHPGRQPERIATIKDIHGWANFPTAGTPKNRVFLIILWIFGTGFPPACTFFLPERISNLRGVWMISSMVFNEYVLVV